ncbi:helix-turn-helix domain-containing protein [Actinopolymorpha sp. B17G11]|uniref:ArsR/SmtB family transcription factor n=1 Tax=Actinopolymorpha sp. B17G11 TaxID=3160861 RepID=UPI0032E37168
MSLEVGSLRALAHPVRLRILSLLTGVALSAAEIARELDISQANASYHVRTLAAAGYLAEAGEETIRGGVAKRYAYVPGYPKTESGDRDPEGQALVYQAIAEELIRRARLCATTPPLPQSLTDAELWVDPEDWRRATDLAMEASQLLRRRAHPPRTEGTVHVSATVAMFPMRSDAPSDAPSEAPSGTSSDASSREPGEPGNG